jgi:hypothetical protein
MSLGELTPELMGHFKFWVKVANYYDKTCSEEALTMYAQHSSEFPVDDLVKAFRQYSEDPKHAFMPKPGQLIGYLKPHIDSDSEAREITARLVRAIATHGYTNSQKAKADIGPEGWPAVEGAGGWAYLCQNHGLSIDPGQFAAQARGVIKTQIERRNAGQTIGLDRQIEGGNSAMKLIEDLAKKKELKSG